MKRQIKNTILVLLAVSLVLSITTAAVNASAGDLKAGFVSKEFKSNGNPNSYVMPVGSHYLGKSYGQWSEEWWKWALSIPIPNNPILDTTGENGAIGQTGKVWFLAGNGETGVSRTVEIPADKAIFFPIINAVSFPFPKTDETDQEMLNELIPYIDNVTVHKVELDGKNIDNFRVRSDFFEFTVPENHYLSLGYPDMPAKSYRGVSDGYWIMLKPLPVGIHKICIYGEIKYPDGSIDVKSIVNYNIIVKPKKC